MVNLSKIKVLAAILITVFNPINIHASNKDYVSIDQIFTQEQGLWYPGRVESKDFYIRNNKENNISIDRLYIRLESSKDLKTNQSLDISSKQFKELSTNSTVKLYYKDKILFQDKLDNLLSEKGIVLAEEINIKSNGKVLLNMTIDMDEKMNNDAESLENIFSMGVAYKIDNNIENVDPEPPIDPDDQENIDSKPNIDPDNLGINVGGSTDGNLPQTGGIINSYSLIALGTVTIGIGILLNKKSPKEKGGKYHE